VCRERFRVWAVLGLQPIPRFDHKLAYGDMWHVCEEALAGGNDWSEPLKLYASILAKRFPHDGERVEHWYNVCRVQFPIYVAHWKKHKDVRHRRPLAEEQVFDVPYALPSGRTVRLRGKWDSVDLIGKGKGEEVWLQENKTKGDIDDVQTQRQLQFDLQTGIYLVALWEYLDDASAGDAIFPEDHGQVRGVRYNIVRRPLSGGKGTITRHKPSKSNPLGETVQSFYGRVREIIETATGPDWKTPEGENWFFSRWGVPITKGDLQHFRHRCLDPILEQLCDWWDWIASGIDPFDTRMDGWGKKEYNPLHWQHPFGVYNVLDEGGSSDLDEFILSGSEAGLRRAKDLFPELTRE
jgi:hypothetical protein